MAMNSENIIDNIKSNLFTDIKMPVDKSKGYKLKLENAFKDFSNKRPINLNNRLKNLMRETGILSFYNMNMILSYVEFIEYLKDDAKGDDKIKHCVLIFNKSNYRKLTSLNSRLKTLKNVGLKKDFIKNTFRKTVLKNQAEDSLFNRNLNLFFEIYMIALDFDNFDKDKIKANISNLLIIANMKFGNKLSNKKRAEAIKWAISEILDDKNIDFKELENKYSNYIPKYEKRKSYNLNLDINLRNILMIKYLLKDKKNNLKNTLEFFLKTKLSGVSESGIKQFMKNKANEKNEKLIALLHESEKENFFFNKNNIFEDFQK